MVKFTGGLAMLAAIAFGAPMAAHAGDSLLIHRVQQEQGMNLPTRGMTMAQVEKRYGAPQRKLQPRGGDTQKHPVINRWDYSTFIVYFEHDHVIHSVLNTPAGNNRNPAAAQ
ncbi:hypothetical protein [Frateuria sp. YIM B11624]|uniref:hypothetical protein n=1 Tax=Frateuria sp. YIM B11624 TaxID=3143185 RepID=UPI003C727162